ncbi:hypothetical protein Pst134EB_030857 [Puccinia striiformis f. sp. tritici]|nr:hypothetical protein Pst134EB_030857 [Puccinia striiformis f. sp. tritici]
MVRSTFLPLFMSILIAAAQCGRSVWEMVVDCKETGGGRQTYQIFPYYHADSEIIEPLQISFTNKKATRADHQNVIIRNDSNSARVLNTGLRNVVLYPQQHVTITAYNNYKYTWMIISPKDGHPVPGCALYGELIDHLMSEMTNKGIAIPLDLRYSKDYFDQHVTDRLTVQSEGGLAGMYSHLPPSPNQKGFAGFR